jgi:hypothetical protein
MPTVTICRLCRERPVPPSRIGVHDYRCSRCRHQTPAMLEVGRRYNQTDRRRAVVKRSNAKRIFLGRQYHSAASTPEVARVINAHIKEQRREFISRQQNREKAQGAAAR